MSLEARIKKIESALGPPEPPDSWEGRDESVRGVIAGFVLKMASAWADHPGGKGRPAPGPNGNPECKAVAKAACNALEARLDAEGLGHAPLDETGMARARVIVRELTRLATVPQIQIPDEHGNFAAMRPSVDSWRSPKLLIPDDDDRGQDDDD